MPGGKLRLKGLFTGGEQVGATGTYVQHILAGSVAFNAEGIAAGSAGVYASGVATITGLTASHIVMATVASGNACTLLHHVAAGADSASFFFVATGSALAAVSATTMLVQYLAFKV